jgi:hypothetical protein
LLKIIDHVGAAGGGGAPLLEPLLLELLEPEEDVPELVPGPELLPEPEDVLELEEPLLLDAPLLDVRPASSALTPLLLDVVPEASESSTWASSPDASVSSEAALTLPALGATVSSVPP